MFDSWVTGARPVILTPTGSFRKATGFGFFPMFLVEFIDCRSTFPLCLRQSLGTLLQGLVADDSMVLTLFPSLITRESAVPPLCPVNDRSLEDRTLDNHGH